METKKCSKCGEVKDVGEFYKNGEYGLRPNCKKCEKEQWQKKNIKNPEKNKTKCRNYLLANSEKEKERIKNYWLKNPENLKNKNNRCNTKKIDNLTDCYIKQTLKLSGFTTEQINENPELIEVKRLIIKTKRLCKTLPN